MTLAIVIIALLVLLVIVDASDTSGAHHGAPPAVEALQAEDEADSAAGSPCILNVTSIPGREPKQRRNPWKPARQGQGEVTRR